MNQTLRVVSAIRQRRFGPDSPGVSEIYRVTRFGSTTSYFWSSPSLFGILVVSIHSHFLTHEKLFGSPVASKGKQLGLCGELGEYLLRIT